MSIYLGHVSSVHINDIPVTWTVEYDDGVNNDYELYELVEGIVKALDCEDMNVGILCNVYGYERE